VATVAGGGAAAGIGIGYADDAELNSLYKTNGRVPVDEILTIKSK